VLNKQRTVIYDERRRVLDGEDIKEQVEHMLGDVVHAYIDGATAEGYAEDWDLDKLWTALGTLYPVGLDRAALVDGDHADDLTREMLTEAVLADARDAYARREAEIDAVIGAQGGMRELERQVLLQVMDRKWREHLYEMDYLKEGIGLRAMAQRDPLIEYQREGYDMFAAMLEGIKEETVGHLFNVRVQAVPATPPAEPVETDSAEASPVERTQPNAAVAPAAPTAPTAPPQGERTARVPARSGSGSGGRHAAPEDDPAATTSALPTVFSGGPRPASELQYSGPAEDGGTTTRGRSRGAPAAGGSARSSGEPARNRPCPCGSGRKYKHCHGMPTAARP
jgi:preprotein translocase subunit SecA